MSAGITIHFRGGPLDGHMRMEQQAPPTYRVPLSPVVDFTADPNEVALPRHAIYERLSGVVGSEAVYEYRGESS